MFIDYTLWYKIIRIQSFSNKKYNNQIVLNNTKPKHKNLDKVDVTKGRTYK